MKNNQVTTFKAKEKEYEIFFAEDGFIELYEKNNPREGFYFESKKQLMMFINTLTDILEKMEMENL